jgi:hypothetical protein
MATASSRRSRYKHDVFISYTHTDNLPHLKGDPGWVTQLNDHLKTALVRRLGREPEVSIWRDDKLKGSECFNERIDQELSQSALLLCVVSPAYQTSPSCQAEIEAFCKWHQRRGNVQSRIIKVVLFNIPPEAQLPALRETLGFSFYDPKPPEEGWMNEYIPRNPADRDQRFWIRLDQLANEIAEALTHDDDSVRDDSSTEPGDGEDGVVTETPSLTIYLAETEYDAEDDRRELLTELQQHGVRVLPEGPLPLPNKIRELERKVVDYLQQSRISVHIFGERYGKPQSDDPRSVAHLQYEYAAQMAAAEQSERQLTRMVWIPPEITIDNLRPEQRDFLKSVEDETGARAPVELNRKDFSAFKASVMTKVRALIEESRQSNKPPKKKIAGGATISVVGREEDFGDATTLISKLTEEQHLIAELPVRNDDARERQVRRAIQCTKRVDGFMLLYGKAAEPNWIVDMILRVKQATQKRPVAMAVYDGPPNEKERLGVHGLLVMNCRNGFCNDEFKKLLALIKDHVS